MEKEIAYKDGIVTKENLPLRYVHFPGFYGGFFGFSSEINSKIYLCECSKPALENYLIFSSKNKIKNYYPEKEFILSSNDFPLNFVKHMMECTDGSIDEILGNIEYKNEICHQCNKAVPSYKYCAEMYGGLFKQTYGWYIKRKAYEIGIDPLQHIPISENIPDEIFDVTNIDPTKYFSERKKILDNNFEGIREFDLLWQKQKRKINNLIENEVRSLFSFKAIGDAWTGETTVYNIILRIFPKQKIIRHFRPKFLEYLELDIYLPALKFGIEYQGQQHYMPIKHWGGKEALVKLKERDQRKLCKINGIKVLYIKYNESLTEKYINNRVQAILVETS